jgi:hypothetical protein
MPKDVLSAALIVLAETVFILALAATVGIPTGKRGPAAQSDDEAGPSGACVRDGHGQARVGLGSRVSERRNPGNSCIQL